MGKSSFRFATYNVQHFQNYAARLLDKKDKRITPECIADVILREGVEICSLQEVDRFVPRSGNCDQLEVLLQILRERSGVNWEGVYAPAIPLDGGEYGVALVSRYPIEQSNTEKVALPVEQWFEGGRFEDRVLLTARIRVGEEILTVLNTHFGLMPAEQDLSVKAIANAVAKNEGALLLAGDFNAQPDDAHIEALCKMLTLAAERDRLPLTYSSDRPYETIDYIFCNGALSVTGLRTVADTSSDHLPLLADVKFL